MFVRLGQDMLNLDHVVRVRFGTAFRNGREELSAEVEGLSPRGELATLTRYKGEEARLLRAALEECCRRPAFLPEEPEPAVLPLSHPSAGTIADLKLPDA